MAEKKNRDRFKTGKESDKQWKTYGIAKKSKKRYKNVLGGNTAAPDELILDH